MNNTHKAHNRECRNSRDITMLRKGGGIYPRCRGKEPKLSQSCTICQMAITLAVRRWARRFGADRRKSNRPSCLSREEADDKKETEDDKEKRKKQMRTNGRGWTLR